MLVLTRQQGQSILIGDNIRIVINAITPTAVKIGIEAPREINIVREEINERR